MSGKRRKFTPEFREQAARLVIETGRPVGVFGAARGYPVRRFDRRGSFCTIGEGTSEIQRMVIARYLLREF